MHRHPRLSLPVRILAVALPFAAARAADPAADTGIIHVTAANTAFALDLYRELATAPGNVFFSPYSLSRVLTMAATGARGPTATELTTALHLGASVDQAAAGYASLTKALQDNAGDNVTLVTADSLWVQDQFPLLDSYLRTVRGQFGAAAMPADFVHNAEGARTAINGWVDEQTHGKITELIGPGMIDATTRVVLCDAIYFKGKWDRQFNPGQTKPAPFHLTPQSQVLVSMMHQMAAFRATHRDDVSLLELPYLGRRFSMAIILPDTVDGLAGVERRLTAGQLLVWLADLAAAPDTMLNVYLPRFTSRNSFRLESQLAQLGMRRAFDRAHADFSGMAEGRELYLSVVVHQAYVRVDEEGTEAAAASGAAMKYFDVPRAAEFRVDHPYLFLIRDNATGTILFLGRVTDPRS